MKKNRMLVALVGVSGLVSVAALAGYFAWKNPAFAEVVSVEPVRQFVAASERTCGEKQASNREPAANKSSMLPVVIDGMAGGMITRQPARLEEIATLRTVAAGDPAGWAAQKNKGPAKTSRSTQSASKASSRQTVAVAGAHCRKADRVSEKIVAYDVRYRLHGKTTKVRMDHDPGSRLPVREGKVVILQDSGPGQPKA